MCTLVVIRSQANQGEVQGLLRLKTVLGRTLPSAEGSGALASFFQRLSEALYKCLQPPSTAAAGAAADPTPQKVEEARRAIAASRVDLFALEAAVFENSSSAYHARSLVQENAALIFKNYSTAFSGNRQLTNQNTDDLFRNRLAIVNHMHKDADNEAKVAYVDAVLYREKLRFLQHRADLNQQVLDLTLQMAEVNTQAIAVNTRVIQTNEVIVAFNNTYIHENTSWLKDTSWLSLASVDEASVTALIEQNTKAVAELMTETEQERNQVVDILEEAKTNRRSIELNQQLVHGRRKKIEANRSSIQANQQAVATRLSQTNK